MSGEVHLFYPRSLTKFRQCTVRSHEKISNSLSDRHAGLPDVLRRRYSTRKGGERGRCEEYFYDNVSFAWISCSFSIKALPKQTI